MYKNYLIYDLRIYDLRLKRQEIYDWTIDEPTVDEANQRSAKLITIENPCYHPPVETHAVRLRDIR
ncbi:MAG: hypothetical protein LUF04_08725, partial [Bacteroides sp.]|nr:hypothetical protein [Bacteroides sp.]